MIRLTVGQMRLLPVTALRAEPAPTIQDHSAFERLQILLDAATTQLEKLASNPIVIAASPNRFNDIYWSDWRAVRVGAFFTERHDYGDRNFELDLASGPPSAKAAALILADLEVQKWRDLFLDAFGITWDDQCLAVVLQDGVPWLVFSSSNNTDENHVFSLWDDRSLVYFGECVERFDWELQEPQPLRFQCEVA